MSESQELIIYEKLSPAEVFKPGGADNIINEIKSRIGSIVFDESQAKAIIKAIAKGQIPNVKINY